MSHLILMCGLSGCGKTVFAKRFAEVYGYNYLGIDEFYEWYNGDEKNRSHTFQVWIEFYQAIHRAEKNRENVIIDTNALTYTKRTQFLDWFSSFDKYTLIHIVTSEELRIKGNLNRERVVPEEVIMEMKRTYDYPTNDSEDERWNEICEVHNNWQEYRSYDLRNNCKEMYGGMSNEFSL